MKYIVEVNAKWLVSIDAESALGAEHKVLEYNGVWGAMAYDRAAMKTDTFAGAVQGCEMISMKELQEMVFSTLTAKYDADAAVEAYKDAMSKVEELTAALEAAKEAAREASIAKANARGEYEKLENLLGKQRQ